MYTSFIDLSNLQNTLIDGNSDVGSLNDHNNGGYSKSIILSDITNGFIFRNNKLTRNCSVTSALGSSTTRMLIYNNFFMSEFENACLNIMTCSSVDIFHNSFRGDHTFNVPASTSSTSNSPLKVLVSTDVQMEKNLIQGDYGYYITQSGITYTDNNLYKHPPTINFGMEQNSVYLDIPLISIDDLHLDQNYPLPLASSSNILFTNVDIDGDLRNASHPQYGADEVSSQVYNDSNVVTQSIQICEGDTLVINGSEYFQSGTYSDSTFIGGNLDSIFIYNVYTLPTTMDFDSIYICEGESVMINNKSE